MINGVLVTPLKIVETQGGDVLHSIQDNSPGFNGFGEAYFSEIEPNSIKAWKLHKKMTLNITVPLGEIKFVLYDERDNLKSMFQELIISRKNYCRLTIPPMIWLGFQGLSNSNSLLLNVADMKHNPKEYIRKDVSEFKYDWRNKK
jgi:dTDP-4-dehydrorhamnose 3,5-epimerase